MGHNIYVDGGYLTEDTGQDILAALGGGATVDAGNSTSANLGIAGVFTGAFLDVKDRSEIMILANSDVDGTIFVDWSQDGISVDVSDSKALTGGTGVSYRVSVKGEYYRVRYVNGGVAQTTFALESITKSGPFTSDELLAINTLIQADTSSIDSKITTEDFDTDGGDDVQRQVVGIIVPDAAGGAIAGTAATPFVTSESNKEVANAADTGDPVKVGARYDLTLPTYDDADRTNLQADSRGRLITTPEGGVAHADPDDNANPLKVGGVVTVADPTLLDDDRAELRMDVTGRLLNTPNGNVASEDTDAGNPVKVGARYDLTLPTYTNGDRTNLQADANGRLLARIEGSVAHDAADDNANPLKVGGVVTAADPTLTDNDRAELRMDTTGRLLNTPNGNVDHDAADAGNPIKIGGVYKNVPAAVSADNDRTELLTDNLGRPRVLAESNVASEVTDAENPIKVGAKYDAALPAYTDGDKTNLQADINGRLLVQPNGNVDHDAVDAGNPIKVGGVYKATPGAVADGDRTEFLTDSAGRQVVVAQTLDVNHTVYNVNSGSNIPASAAVPLTIITLTADVKKIQVVDTSGEFIGIYSDPAGTPVLEFIIGPGSDNTIEVNLPNTTVLGARNMENSAINVGTLALNLMG